MARKTNREMWIKHVNNQSSSELSQKKWCEENNVNFHNFAYWIGRLKKEGNVTAPSEMEWVTVVPEESYINDSNSTSPVTISIGNAVILFNPDTNIESFEKVVQVLVKYV